MGGELTEHHDSIGAHYFSDDDIWSGASERPSSRVLLTFFSICHVSVSCRLSCVLIDNKAPLQAHKTTYRSPQISPLSFPFLHLSFPLSCLLLSENIYSTNITPLPCGSCTLSFYIVLVLPLCAYISLYSLWHPQGRLTIQNIELANK